MARFEQVPIRNFSRVSGTMFRGAEPIEPNAILFLRGLGVKTIVDLRKESTATRAEREVAAAHNLNYFNIAMGYIQIPDHVVAAFLAISLHPHYQPFFVHCSDGIDRSSTMVAIYRIAVEGWPIEWAQAEMEAHGFGQWQWFLKRIVQRFGERMHELTFQQRLSAVQELVESTLFTEPAQ